MVLDLFFVEKDSIDSQHVSFHKFKYQLILKGDSQMPVFKKIK
jgi:hypothetical protein